MKKQIALMTTAVIAITLLAAPSVFAEEAGAGSTSDNPVVFDYKDVDESVYEAQWWDTGLGFDICLPADWIDNDLTDEMTESGVVHIYGEEGGGANCTIVYTELPEEVVDTYDINQLGTEIAASNTTALFADLSGIPAVVFENDETFVTGFSILTDDGCLIQGVISAPSDDQYDEYDPVFKNIITSISPTETETEAE